jgi:hypothetical protein
VADMLVGLGKGLEWMEEEVEKCFHWQNLVQHCHLNPLIQKLQSSLQ